MRDTSNKGRPTRPQTVLPTTPAKDLSAGFEAALGGSAKKPHLVEDKPGKGKKALRNIEKDGAKQMLKNARKPGPAAMPRKGHR